MGKFESYPSINSLSDDDITLYNRDTVTHKVTFLQLARLVAERVADPVPMPNSDNLVTSRGIYDAIQSAVENKADKADTLAGYGIVDAYTMTDCDIRFFPLYDTDSSRWDNEPTEDSVKPVISGGIYDAIQDATTDMVGATANDDGARGLVPQPLAGDENKVLRGDGTWGDAASSVSDLTDVNLTNLSDKQLLRYNNTSSKWENISSDTTPTQNSTNPITSGGVYDVIQSFSTNFVGTLAEWNTLTPAEQAEYKTKDITDDYNGLPIDAVPTQSSMNPVSSGGVYTALATKANESTIAPVQTTLVASQEYKIGEQFIYNGVLYKATALISNGGTITINGNCIASDDITTQISNFAQLSSDIKQISSTYGTGTFTFYKIGRLVTVSYDFTLSANANQADLLTVSNEFLPIMSINSIAPPYDTSSFTKTADVYLNTEGKIRMYAGLSGKRYLNSFSYITAS